VFRPRIAILNNGATKGGAAPILSVLRDADGLENVWQLHRSEIEDAAKSSPGAGNRRCPGCHKQRDQSSS
jgi:hypothetical protein